VKHAEGILRIYPVKHLSRELQISASEANFTGSIEDVSTEGMV